MERPWQRVRTSAPLALLIILVALLGVFVVQAVGALGQAGAAQPAEPWLPAPDFTRGPSQDYPVELALWPPGMAGQQPLRSLAIQFDNPRLYKGPMLLTVRNANRSTSQFPIVGRDLHDNDYVSFPMDGKTPISATLTTLGDDTATVIGVTGPDVDTATCAIYELMDGTRLTPAGCS